MESNSSTEDRGDALAAAVALLAPLDAEVVERCPDLDCALCGTALIAAA